jgi:hemerythrin-like domain-containing protein
MKATEILKEEHRVIERVLNALEVAVTRLESGESVRLDSFLEAAEFFKGFADGCHHKKEEDVLFVRMQEHGLPARSGPIGIMLSEHELGRSYIQALKEMTLKLQNGDPTALPCVVQSARSYIFMLRQHIIKEDQILFSMADQVIPVEKHEQIFEDFEKVEHEETGEGVHEKYLALAEALEKELCLTPLPLSGMLFS